jgi:hypothetical protein
MCSTTSTILTTIGTMAGTFLIGVLGWFVSSFFGGPLRKFFDLRGEVVRQMARFANVPARWRELPDDMLERVEPAPSKEDEERLNEAKKVLRDLASQMKSFALNEPFAMRVLTWLRYDPVSAGGGLFGLSEGFDRYGNSKHSARKKIEEALRFSDI